MYNVLNVSNFIINYGNMKGFNITLSKLNKLLYFTQIAFMRVYNEPAFMEIMYLNDSGIYIKEVYDKYEKFGGNRLVDNGRYLMADNDKVFIGMIVDALGGYENDVLWRVVNKKRLLDLYLKSLRGA